MSEQENTATENEVETVAGNDFPEVYTKADAMANQDDFSASVAVATEGIAEARQYFAISDIQAEVPDDFNVVIDVRDAGSFKDKPASFVYAIPTFEAVAALGEKGQAFIKDCVESALTRRAAAQCAAVNRGNAELNIPKTLAEWLETSKPAATGKRLPSRKGWSAINELLVSAINKQYSDNNNPNRITKRELTSCMANAAFAELKHPAIKAWDNIFAVAEKQITEHCASEENVKAEKPLEAAKELAILAHWKSTRDQKEEVADMEITELVIG